MKYYIALPQTKNMRDSIKIDTESIPISGGYIFGHQVFATPFEAVADAIYHNKSMKLGTQLAIYYVEADDNEIVNITYMGSNQCVFTNCNTKNFIKDTTIPYNKALMNYIIGDKDES